MKPWQPSMDERHPLGPISHRTPELVLALLGHVYEADNPVPWIDLVGQYSSDRWPWLSLIHI